MALSLYPLANRALWSLRIFCLKFPSSELVRRSLCVRATVRNSCHYEGCPNSARKGHECCLTHAGSAPLQTTTIAAKPKPSGNASVLLRPVSGRKQLDALRAENLQLRKEAKRLNQIEADRLRFEKESQKAWDEVRQLRILNEELRLENKHLQSRVADLEETVSTITKELSELRSDPYVIEIAEVFKKLESTVVKTIRGQQQQFVIYLCDLQFDQAVFRKWEEHFKLTVQDLYVLQTILSAAINSRNSKEHPVVNCENADKWKETLHVLCGPEVPEESISQLVDIAVTCC